MQIDKEFTEKIQEIRNEKVRNLVIACMAITAACMLQNNDAKVAEVGNNQAEHA